MKPIKGKSYTLREILSFPSSEVDVFLEFTLYGDTFPLQDSHLSREDLLSIAPGFADTTWVFTTTTREMIDVFMYNDSRDINQFIERADWGVGTPLAETVYCPKGFPREDPWKGTWCNLL